MRNDDRCLAVTKVSNSLDCDQMDLLLPYETHLRQPYEHGLAQARYSVFE
jgi:hypothetical protein